MYNETAKKATIKYIKASQKTINLKWKRSEYEAEIEPAIRKSKKPVSTFIKEAVREKIEREGYTHEQI